MSKHTPGPWRAEEDIDGDFNIRSGDWYIAMTCSGVGRHDQEDPTKANAQLISAAPDLLIACDAALGFADNIREGDHYKPYEIAEIQALLRGAIAKAEGQQ